MNVMFNDERNLYITRQLNIDGVGLEIAPYFNPAVKKSQHRVYYTDYCDTEALRKKAAENPSLANREIPAVDFVWKPGEKLSACVPDGLSFDYAIASHVLEHVADPIGWINQVLATLRIGGKFALVLPDKRESSDYYRRLTDLADILAAAIQGSSRPTPSQTLDFMLKSVYDDQPGGDRPYEIGLPFEQAKRYYGDSQAFEMARACYNAQYYLDVHCTVWTCSSFYSVMSRCIAMKLIAAELSEPYDNRFEFIAIFTKNNEVPEFIRRDFEAELEHYKHSFEHYKREYEAAQTAIEELKNSVDHYRREYQAANQTIDALRTPTSEAPMNQ